ncbi:MAG TPA: DinB family protein [Candidatus Limnocylindrales bacterium]|nr:DinB family protein [Candidatus Limnocylindrales bacterium]
MADDFLIQHTPGPTVEVPPGVLAARRAIATATTDLLAIPDAALETGWPWRNDEADVRYGLYRAIEAIEEAGTAVERLLRGRPAARPPAADRIAPATIARWDLHGLLASVDERLLDRHPGGGEWTLRQTLAHIVGGQRAYGWFTAWWASRPADEPAPDGVPESVRDAAGLPDEEIEGEGTLLAVRARFDAILDLSAGRLGYLDDDGLARPARWAGIPVTIGFRLGRWSSHVIEHTVQLDKTLVVLGRHPTEVERLVRHIHGAYGRLEALVFGMPAAALEVAGPRGRSIDAVLADLGAELVADAQSARAAAGA